jgi:hypothetical protein
MFVKLVLLVTFFWCTFLQLFNGFEISVKFCVFDIYSARDWVRIRITWGESPEWLFRYLLLL